MLKSERQPAIPYPISIVLTPAWVSHSARRKHAFVSSEALDMAVYGYAQVSTDGQTLAAHDAALHAAGCAKVYSEKISGARSDRPQLAKLLRWLDEGDTVIVTRPDRLGPQHPRRAQHPSRYRQGRCYLQVIGRRLRLMHLFPFAPVRWIDLDPLPCRRVHPSVKDAAAAWEDQHMRLA